MPACEFDIKATSDRYRLLTKSEIAAVTARALGR